MSVGEVLTSKEHYRSLTRSLPRLSREEEAEIVRRAKEEDAEAREQVITNCLTYIEFIAKRYEKYLHHDDYLDLVSIGSLAVVENFSRALVKDNPSGWLRSRGKYAIIHYCFTRANLIVRPDHSAEAVHTTSLDEKPYTYDTLADKAPVVVRECPDYTYLYEGSGAIAKAISRRSDKALRLA